MKTLPRFWPNQFYKKIIGTILLGSCLSSFAQLSPLETPKKTEYPGILQTFEKLIQVDNEKFQKRSDILLKNSSSFSGADTVSGLDLEPDFLNSIILHSDPGYLRLASTDKCRFYETILTDLLKSSEGKIKNILITYLEKNNRQSAIVSKKDFLAKVVNLECPETQKNIAAFQVKTIESTLKSIRFDIPTGIDECRNVHSAWLTNPKTPFLCQIHEYVKEAKSGTGDPKTLEQRQSVAKILDSKMSLLQKDYIENICRYLDEEELFCEEFLNVSFWTKIAAGQESKVYGEDICRFVMGTPNPTNQQLSICLARLKKEKDLCLYPSGPNSGLTPGPDCDQLSTALNYSSLKANFQDCPGNSDQMVATNMGRIIQHFSPAPLLPTEGTCSTSSAGMTFDFNQKFDNDENWKLEACYVDQFNQKDICMKTFFGKYGNLPESYTNVVAKILQKTRGADASEVCKMVSSAEYNPLLLQYKSGCYIVYDKDNCFISQCKHKIIFNDRPLDFIKIKNRATLAYFPLNIKNESYSQHYLLTRDFKRSAKQLNSLSSITNYFKKSKSRFIHGIACAEDILPSFFKVGAINQCTPLPFIINGIIKDQDKVVLVVRTGADSLQSPRLISWSNLFSGVKSYQQIHPLRTWTMYGLD